MPEIFLLNSSLFSRLKKKVGQHEYENEKLKNQDKRLSQSILSRHKDYYLKTGTSRHSTTWRFSIKLKYYAWLWSLSPGSLTLKSNVALASRFPPNKTEAERDTRYFEMRDTFRTPSPAELDGLQAEDVLINFKV